MFNYTYAFFSKHLFLYCITIYNIIYKIITVFLQLTWIPSTYTPVDLRVGQAKNISF